MAMTRTRYRTQSTLTFLAEQLAAVEWALAKLPAEQAARRPGLVAQRDALRETIAQFDPKALGEVSAENSVFGAVAGT